jgi:DNA-binding IclR family transcriptional regulator
MTDGSVLALRALSILEAMAAGRQSLPAIAAEAGLPISTAHRIIVSLIGRGYLVAPARGHYHFGPAALRIAQAVSGRDMLIDIGRPTVARLARAARAHAHMGLLEQGMVTYIVKQPYGRGAIPSVEGTQLEAYCTGIGKVLLAHDADGSAESALRGPFVALTPNTITTEAELAAELARIRTRGWAIDDEELVSGLRCIAVPVHHGNAQQPPFALSLSFPAAKTSIEALQDQLPRLFAAADEISRQLGVGGSQDITVIPAKAGIYKLRPSQATGNDGVYGSPPA